MNGRTRPLWLIVDGNNSVCRDAFVQGVAAAPASFARRMAWLRGRFLPDVFVAVWDSPGGSFRNRIASDYKAGRERLPGIDQAIDEAKAEACEHVGLLSVSDYEADDIAATLTRKGLEAGARVVLYSSDKDLHGLLVADHVTQLTQIKRTRDDVKLFWRTAADVFGEFGVTPEQWRDFKTMVGDKSDNVAGVRKVGPEYAARVLSQCGSLDGFYENPFACNVPNGIRTALFNARPTIDTTRRLVTLRKDVPIPHDWLECCP